MTGRTPFTPDVVARCFARQDSRCAMCGRSLRRDDRGNGGEDYMWQAHHINGEASKSWDANCAIVCHPCHVRAHDEDFSYGALYKRGRMRYLNLPRRDER